MKRGTRDGSDNILEAFRRGERMPDEEFYYPIFKKRMSYGVESSKRIKLTFMERRSGSQAEVRSEHL